MNKSSTYLHLNTYEKYKKQQSIALLRLRKEPFRVTNSLIGLYHLSLEGA